MARAEPTIIVTPHFASFFGQVERNQDAYKPQPRPEIPAFQRVLYQLAGRAGYLDSWHLPELFHQRYDAG
jgi:hypothetical protein